MTITSAYLSQTKRPVFHFLDYGVDKTASRNPSVTTG